MFGEDSGMQRQQARFTKHEQKSAVAAAKEHPILHVNEASNSNEPPVTETMPPSTIYTQVLLLSDAQMSTLTPRRSSDKPKATIPSSAPHRLEQSLEGRGSLWNEQMHMKLPLTCSPTPRKKHANLQGYMFDAAAASSNLIFPPRSPARQASCCSSVSMSSSCDDDDCEDKNCNPPGRFPSQIAYTNNSISPASSARVVLSFAQASILSSTQYSSVDATTAAAAIPAMSPLRRVASAPMKDASHVKSRHHYLQRSMTMDDSDHQMQQPLQQLVPDRWNSSNEFTLSARRELVHGTDDASDNDGSCVNERNIALPALPPPLMGRTKSMDMAVPVPRRRRSVSSSDLELFQHSQHTCSTMGDWSSSRLLCHDEVHCYESGSNSFRPRSASLDEPAHVPTRRTSIRANASSVDLYQAYNDMSEQCNVPRSSVHSTSLQNTHSSSMPILPRRILSSTDLASDAYDEQPHASGMFLDDYEHLNETMDDTRVTKSSIDDKVQAVKVVNRDAAAASSYTAKRKSMGSKVSTKTEAIESSEDSTSGWSDNWSPSPTRNVSGRFVDLHKAASVPCLTCPQKPHHHGMIPSAVRRLVRRTRSASPTSQVHPGFGRLMQVVANVVRKEHHQHRKSYSKDNEFLSSTEFLEPSSLYMDQPQHGPTRLVVVQDGSAVTHVADMKKRRSSSSSGSQPSMFRTKLFGRS